MRIGEKIKEQRIYSGRPTKRQKEQIRKFVGRTKSLGEMKERKDLRDLVMMHITE